MSNKKYKQAVGIMIDVFDKQSDIRILYFYMHSYINDFIWNLWSSHLSNCKK